MKLIKSALLLMMVVVGMSVGADERPNFVFIIADDISQEDFGCYGHPSIRTPNVDQLARSGMRFDNVYLTTSQCSPSRCSIITGRYPHNAGAPELRQYFGAEQIMFPKMLKDSGYYTAQAGKWHLGANAKAAFDYTNDKGVPSGAENWISVLRNRPKGQPFFVWFASRDAHRGWQADPDAKPHTLEDVVVPPYLYDCPEMREDLRCYYDEVQRFDRYVGKVVAELKAQGVYENTCIMVTADNARAFPRCKLRLYDSGLKTPFVINWPGRIKPGSVSDSLVSSLDIAPTLVEAAGLESPENFQGVSFAPLFDDPAATIRKYVFGEHNWHGFLAHERMVRHGDYVYIRNAYPELVLSHNSGRDDPGIDYRKLAAEGKLTPAQMNPLLDPRPVDELFKLSKDPDQIMNLAGNPEYADVLKKMQGLMDEWQQRTGDTVPPREDATPDRYDRLTHEKNPKWKGPGKRDYPGKATNAHLINDPGPR